MVAIARAHTRTHTLEMLPFVYAWYTALHCEQWKKNIINNGIVWAVVEWYHSLIYSCVFFLPLSLSLLFCVMLSGCGWGETKLLEPRVFTCLYVCLFIYLLADIARAFFRLFVRFFLSLLLSIHPWLFLKLKQNDNTVHENMYKMQVLHYTAYLVCRFRCQREVGLELTWLGLAWLGTTNTQMSLILIK